MGPHITHQSLGTPKEASNELDDMAVVPQHFLASAGPIDLGTVLQTVCSDPRYLSNISYGSVRRGHPEGTVMNHIREIEGNIDSLTHSYHELAGIPLSSQTVLELKIIAHVHDSFKADSRKGARIEDPDSHASLAVKFLKEFTSDERLRSVVQLHDLPYSMYRNFIKFGSVNEERINYLLVKVPDLILFTLFQLVDNITLGKLPEPGKPSAVEWFISEIKIRGAVPANMLDLRLACGFGGRGAGLQREGGK
jgi:hypothetical protein